MAADYVGSWKILYDWQTLITGALAVLAAWVAARPVWEQLKTLQVQSEVMARDTLITRVATLELRRDATKTHLTSITSDCMRGLHGYDDDRVDIHPEWAHDAEQIVDRVIGTLISQQEASLDGELIDLRRNVTIKLVKELSGCLSAIHTPESHDLHDPELNLTEGDIAAAVAAATAAEGNLESCIAAVAKSGDDLDAAYKVGLERLRDRIRRINSLVTRGERRRRATMP
jgi:hypothetical protein